MYIHANGDTSNKGSAVVCTAPAAVHVQCTCTRTRVSLSQLQGTYVHLQVALTGSTLIYNATLQSAFSVLCPLPDVDELFEDLGVNQLIFKYVLHSCLYEDLL